MMVLVTYDVSTTSRAGRRRLRQVAKKCLDFGQRVQNSVFECQITWEQWTRLRLDLLDLIDPSEDSLRFYMLGSRWRGRVEHHGASPTIDFEDPLIT
ncbi:MAG: CRISPR-associated endonuclease Cas2 [Gammaproteobacteria bacterium]|nr:CRISPR-associated endonuclease Cas2 [Gammaproteobacteria bacterium]MDE0249265.1 CRISPR-associated endonuclease Cas2 [Gammaproteobacteria bacterium]